MNRYTMKGAGGRRSVLAENEAQARSLAMEMRWGKPRGMYQDGYRGLGLIVESVEPATAKDEPDATTRKHNS